MTNSNNIVELDADQGYATAHAELKRAKAERDIAQAEVNRLAREVYESEQRVDDKREVAANDAAALAFLAGKEPPSAPATLRQQLDEARRKLAILERAVAIARQRHADARRRLNAIAVKAAQPHHAEAVKRVATALIDLALALEEEAAIRGDLDHSLALPPMGFSGVGHLGAIDSTVTYWLKRAVGLGFIPADFRAEDIAPRRQATRDAARARAASARAGQPQETASTAGAAPNDARSKIARAARSIARLGAAVE